MIVRFAPKPEELNRLRVGPLGPHVQGFAGLLRQQGYCRDNGWQKMKLVADLSRWLQRKRIALRQLDERRSDALLQARWKRVSRKSGDLITLSQLLQHLRRSHAIPVPSPDRQSDFDLIEQDYRIFLLQERAFVPDSANQYVGVIRRFLSDQFSNIKVRLKNLCAKEVSDFVLHDTATRGRRSAQLMATAL